MERKLFTDGFNSIVHLALGVLLGAQGLLLFAAYQWVLKPDVNSLVDTTEYLIGMGLARK
jgi:hypothetical protein